MFIKKKTALAILDLKTDTDTGVTARREVVLKREQARRDATPQSTGTEGVRVTRVTKVTGVKRAIGVTRIKGVMTTGGVTRIEGVKRDTRVMTESRVTLQGNPGTHFIEIFRPEQKLNFKFHAARHYCKT